MPHMLGRTKRREQRCPTSHPKKNPRHTFHSPDRIIGQCRHRDPTRRCMRSSLPATSDPCPRSSRQSIPIGHALGNGLVQPIFSPPSRRSPLVCSPSFSRRDAGLKMLCVMLQSPRRGNRKFAALMFDPANIANLKTERWIRS